MELPIPAIPGQNWQFKERQSEYLPAEKENTL